MGNPAAVPGRGGGYRGAQPTPPWERSPPERKDPAMARLTLRYLRYALSYASAVAFGNGLGMN
jgi:hypothetical protein